MEKRIITRALDQVEKLAEDNTINEQTYKLLCSGLKVSYDQCDDSSNSSDSSYESSFIDDSVAGDTITNNISVVQVSHFYEGLVSGSLFTFVTSLTIWLCLQ